VEESSSSLHCTHKPAIWAGLKGNTLAKFMALCVFRKKSDWGTLVPRTNVENVMKLGIVLE
jgi:hypothetical protein